MNKSNVSIADQYAVIADQIRVLEAQKKILRDAILNCGETLIQGKDYDVVVSSSTRTTIKVDAVRAILSAEDLAKVSSISLAENISVRAKRAKAA